jgi:hypothetical protein
MTAPSVRVNEGVDTVIALQDHDVSKSDAVDAAARFLKLDDEETAEVVRKVNDFHHSNSSNKDDK